jgi:methanogenic corrinoid protein MtbC1
MSMTPRLQVPSGAPPPASVRVGGVEVELEPLAREICELYRALYPDERERRGTSGELWCLHDTLYLLAWALDDLRPATGQLVRNVMWLARVLAARGFPLERLARHLQLASEVVLRADVPEREALSERLQEAGRRVSAGVVADSPPASSPVRDAYLAALLRADPRGAADVIAAAREGGMTVPELYLSVFQPALYEVGRLWQVGEATVAQEHLATATTQTLVSRLDWGRGSPPDPDRIVITTATQDELHAMGSRFLADFLETDGWTVIDLGAGTPTEDLVRLAAQIRPTLVCLSTALSTNLVHAQAAVDALHELGTPPLIAAGGHAYGGDPSRPQAVGADLGAQDAGSFIQALRARLIRAEEGGLGPG